MGVFTRFKDIVNANINTLLDKAEDPEKMLRLMMQEMEDTLIDLKSSCAAKMAQQVRSGRKIEEANALTERWQMRARMAVSKGRDDLAREALLEKRKASEELARLQKDFHDMDTLIEDAKKEIGQLEEKLRQTKDRYKLLSEKAKRAKEEKRAEEQLRSQTSSRFDDLEMRINRMHAEQDLEKKEPSVEAKFRTMEERDEIEQELAKMKQDSEAR